MTALWTGSGISDVEIDGTYWTLQCQALMDSAYVIKRILVRNWNLAGWTEHALPQEVEAPVVTLTLQWLPTDADLIQVYRASHRIPHVTTAITHAASSVPQFASWFRASDDELGVNEQLSRKSKAVGPAKVTLTVVMYSRFGGTPPPHWFVRCELAVLGVKP